jgi:hypothetical protein
MKDFKVGDKVKILGLSGLYDVLKVSTGRIYYSPSNDGVIDKGFFALICYVTPA